MKFIAEYERIDDIRSIAAMRRELTQLDDLVRQQVIIYALAKSRCQFTWSFFADLFKVSY
jgi:hypothetical protein